MIRVPPSRLLITVLVPHLISRAVPASEPWKAHPEDEPVPGPGGICSQRLQRASWQRSSGALS